MGWLSTHRVNLVGFWSLLLALWTAWKVRGCDRLKMSEKGSESLSTQVCLLRSLCDLMRAAWISFWEKDERRMDRLLGKKSKRILLNFIIWPIPFLLKVHLPQRITLEMVHLITCARDGWTFKLFAIDFLLPSCQVQRSRGSWWKT